MFDKITQNDVLTSIKVLVREDNFSNSDSTVWWRGNAISPNDILSKHYELQGISSSIRNFNTKEAEGALLKLGFPIVDFSRDDDFFTQKELNSFSQLINNRFYDKSKLIDKNIGEFISNAIWKKTKKWRDELMKMGWFKDNDRYTWQMRSSSKQGNNYRKYTWFKIFPDKNTSKLVFFTVGVGIQGNLEYKLDIQESDKFFKQEDKNWFYTYRNEGGEGVKTINKDDVYKENWGTLVEKTNEYFERTMVKLNTVSSHFWPEKRLMRLVYNDNNWQIPMERYWNKKWQGKKDKAHHEQYGYGLEEWLFNSRYIVNGIQYGYVRGVDTMPGETYFIDELYLYTIEPQTKSRLLIAKIREVELLKEEDDIDQEVLDVFESNRGLMKSELKSVNADLKLINKMPLLPNLSFDLDNLFFFDEPVQLPDELIKIPRFIPHIVDDDILKIIKNINSSDLDPKLKFKEGNGTGKNEYNQQIGGGRRTVSRTHADITNNLHKFLINSVDYKGYKISTEKTRVGNNLVDCAARKGGVLELFEVKTTKSFLMNVRLALGQILEYALLDKDISINKLVIVGPAEPREKDVKYFESLKNLLSIPLEYWSYSFEESDVNKKIRVF